MQIGLLGSGQVSQQLARHAVAAGHDILLSNRRGPASLAPLVAQLGPRARAVTPGEAAAAPLVILGVRWADAPTALAGLPPWNGRILVDPTNAFRDGGPASGIVDTSPRATSEVIAALAPGARVVKALNTIYMTRFATPAIAPGVRRVLFLSGDDADAKRTVANLLDSFGFATVDLGDLHHGGLLQQVGGPLAGPDFHLAA